MSNCISIKYKISNKKKTVKGWDGILNKYINFNANALKIQCMYLCFTAS